MKNSKNNPQNPKILDVLKKLTKRIEAATVDIHEIKRNLTYSSLKLGSIESNSKIMKVDIENMKESIDDMSNTTHQILVKMVTQKEFKELSERVAVLEQQ